MMKRMTLKFDSPSPQGLVRIDPDMARWIAALGRLTGVVLVHTPHSTGGICLTNHKDPATSVDVRNEIDRLVPTRVDFAHVLDTPRDAAGHVKTVLVGASASLPVVDGELALGSAQGVFFCEFDGPRSRRVDVYFVVSEQNEAPEVIRVSTGEP